MEFEADMKRIRQGDKELRAINERLKRMKKERG